MAEPSPQVLPRPRTPPERRELWWLFAFALLLLGAGYGLRDPWPADEPRFVLVAKQMLEGGDWLFPHRGIELYPDKPPLYFWLLAAAKQAAQYQRQFGPSSRCRHSPYSDSVVANTSVGSICARLNW
jgi:hypothetical protein